MSRFERLVRASERWQATAALFTIPGADPEAFSGQHGRKRLNGLGSRLFCLKHASRCLDLARRAKRQETAPRTPWSHVECHRRW